MNADGECARTAMTARSARKCLLSRGLGRGWSKKRIKKGSWEGPGAVRGACVVGVRIVIVLLIARPLLVRSK